MSVTNSPKRDRKCISLVSQVLGKRGIGDMHNFLGQLVNLNLEIQGFGRLSQDELRALHILAADHSRQLVEQLIASESRFLRHCNGGHKPTIVSFTLPKNMSLSAHRTRFIVRGCSPWHQWERFLKSLHWCDEKPREWLPDKQKLLLISKLRASRPGYSNESFIDLVISTGLSNRTKLLRFTELLILERLSKVGLSRVYFENFLDKRSESWSSFVIKGGFRGEDWVHSQMDLIFKSLSASYRRMNATGATSQLLFWADSSYRVGNRNLLEVAQKIQRLHELHSQAAAYLAKEFGTLSFDAVEPLFSFCDLVDRYHRVYISHPNADTMGALFENERSRLIELQKFYASNQRIELDGRFRIETKNPFQDI